MSDNVRFLCEQLQSKFVDATGFAQWLEAGVRSIVLDHTDPAEAFRPGAYIVGHDWKGDLRATHDTLDQRSRGLLRAGLQQAMDLIASDRQANNPEANDGRNGEHLTLTYLSLARDWKCGEVLPCIDALIHTKFPLSRAVYTASLSTWRVLAAFDASTDWRSVFLPSGQPGDEPRFLLVYSVSIVLGMCAAQPRRTAEFLSGWRPFQQYLHTLSHNIELGMAPEFQKLMGAYSEIRHGITELEVFERTSSIGKLYRTRRQLDGEQVPPWSEALRHAHQAARMSQRTLVRPNHAIH